jgi:hypothetical protein
MQILGHSSKWQPDDLKINLNWNLNIYNICNSKKGILNQSIIKFYYLNQSILNFIILNII